MGTVLNLPLEPRILWFGLPGSHSHTIDRLPFSVPLGSKLPARLLPGSTTPFTVFPSTIKKPAEPPFVYFFLFDPLAAWIERIGPILQDQPHRLGR